MSLQAFAEVYAGAVLEAGRAMNVHLAAGEAIEDWALASTMGLVEQIERAGVESVQHYGVNREGGAFRLTCERLGLKNSARALQDFIDKE